jgi:hypothetical protein
LYELRRARVHADELLLDPALGLVVDSLGVAGPAANSADQVAEAKGGGRVRLCSGPGGELLGGGDENRADLLDLRRLSISREAVRETDSLDSHFPRGSGEDLQQVAIEAGHRNSVFVIPAADREHGQN